MSDEPKFCKDCKHYREATYVHLLGIASPDHCSQPTERDMVSGERIRASPGLMRSVFGACQSAGLLWEEKPAPETEPTYRIDVIFGRHESAQRERREGDTVYFEARSRNIDKDEIAGPWTDWEVISSMTMRAEARRPRWWEFWK